MSFNIAVVRDEPTRTRFDSDEGEFWAWTAKADTAVGNQEIVVVALPESQGDESPYHAGDRVLVGMIAGTGYILRQFSTSSDHGGHRVIRPRGDKSVLVGSGDGDPQPLMLYQDAHATIAELRQTMIETVLPYLGAAMTFIGNAEGVEACADAITALAALGDGQASKGVKGRST